MSITVLVINPPELQHCLQQISDTKPYFKPKKIFMLSSVWMEFLSQFNMAHYVSISIDSSASQFRYTQIFINRLSNILKYNSNEFKEERKIKIGQKF
jgi:hypothetical protein